MAAASRGKAMSGPVVDKDKAAVFPPWRLAFGVGSCRESTSDVPVSPIRRRHRVRTVRCHYNTDSNCNGRVSNLYFRGNVSLVLTLSTACKQN